MKKANWLWIFLAVFLMSCSEPLPLDKLDYSGQWNGDQMQLHISREGRVLYKRKKNGVDVSLDAPLQRFEGNNFIVGVGLINTKFVVDQPPREIDGRWTMVVDGVQLTRSSD
jgi:hypothetical protein